MRSEEEIRELLKKLEEVYNECMNELRKVRDVEAMQIDLRKCEVEIGSHFVFTDFEHNGIIEWIRALKWVLGE